MATAKGRMLNRSISTSRKLAKCDDRTALIFSWIIPHTDDYGRMDGEAKMVKAQVCPLRDYTEKDVQTSLDQLESVGLIRRYEVNGETYLEVIAYNDNQYHRPDRQRKGECPDPVSGQIPNDDSSLTPDNDSALTDDNDNELTPDDVNKVKLNKIKLNKVKGSAQKIFKKPTLEEVTAYCTERGNKVNPQKWLDHYESNGWKVGRNPMKDWKAAVRTWEQNRFDTRPISATAKPGKYDKLGK